VVRDAALPRRAIRLVVLVGHGCGSGFRNALKLPRLGTRPGDLPLVHFRLRINSTFV